jgi:hypothetical protein
MNDELTKTNAKWSSPNTTDEQKAAVIEELQNTFIYNAGTGELTRKKPKGRRPSVNGRRSQYVEFGRNRITAAQVCWAIQYSLPTPPKIYHLDGDKTNLKLENLHYKRPAKQPTTKEKKELENA